MTIGLFGGTGFIGSHITEKLHKDGHTLRLLVRTEAETPAGTGERIEIVRGRLQDIDALKRLIHECDILIYTVGIIREYPQKGITFEDLHHDRVALTAKLAYEAGVKRYILISANGVKQDGVAYQTSKYRGETALKESGLDWTILRPSIVFGNPRGRKEFCTDIRDSLLKMPLPAPLFYSGILPHNPGGMKFTPVHVDDLSAVVAAIIKDDKSIGKTIPLGGPDSLDWKKLLSIIAEASGLNKIFLPAPVALAKSLAFLFDRFAWFPASRDQLTMLMEGNVCDSKEIFRNYSIEAKKFSLNGIFYLR